jgi:hypothetical protein
MRPALFDPNHIATGSDQIGIFADGAIYNNYPMLGPVGKR